MSDSGGTGSAQPAAGWYRDPTDPSKLRWWDGARWTPSVRDATSPHSEVDATRTDAAAAPMRRRDRPREAANDGPGTEVEVAPRQPAAADASLGTLVADLGQRVAPRDRPGTAPTPRIVWVAAPGREPNGPAAASLVTGILSIVLNPLLLTSIAAWITGGIALRRRASARAGWGIGLGIVGAALWGLLMVFAIVHPVVFKIQWWNMPSAAATMQADVPALATSGYGDWDVAWLAFDMCETFEVMLPAMRDVVADGSADGAAFATEHPEVISRFLTFSAKHAQLLMTFGGDPATAFAAGSDLGTAMQPTLAAVCPGLVAELGYLGTVASLPTT